MDRSAAHHPTDVRVGVDNTLTLLGHKLPPKSIVLVREYQDDLPLVPANAGELNQVWTNLIDSAIDAMAEKGHEGHIEVRSKPGETVICVRLPVEWSAEALA